MSISPLFASLGCNYYFTSDEVRVRKGTLYLVEAKNTKEDRLPSLEDIKDGLIRMVLFTNLEQVAIKGKVYPIMPVLKLTSAKRPIISKRDAWIIRLLKKEAKHNGFQRQGCRAGTILLPWRRRLLLRNPRLPSCHFPQCALCLFLYRILYLL